MDERDQIAFALRPEARASDQGEPDSCRSPQGRIITGSQFFNRP